MGLRITNNGGESVLTVDVNTQKSTSTSIVVEFSGINNIYVGTWIVHLWNNDTNGTEELEMLGVKEIYLERGSVSGSVTFSGLTPNTTYYIGVVTGDYSTWGEDSFSFTTASDTTDSEVDGFIVESTPTSHSIAFKVTGDNTSHSEVTFTLYLKEEDDNGWWQDVTVEWEFGDAMSMEFEFDNLNASTTYILMAPELVDNKILATVTTKPHSIFFDDRRTEVTSSAITVSLNKKPKDEGYNEWTYYIREVGDLTILDSDKNTSTQLGSGRSFSVDGLKSNTKYYIWVELENYSAQVSYIVGIYVTTSPSENTFSWTYAGKKKNDDGTYELIIGKNKGADGAEYFYLTADEWNELTDSINVARNKKGDLPIDFIVAVPDAVFTWTMYNEALDSIYYLTSETASSDKRAVKGGSVTAEKLNHLKDKLNEYLES